MTTTTTTTPPTRSAMTGKAASQSNRWKDRVEDGDWDPVRHGVPAIRTGQRFTLALVFHDAA